MDFYNLDLILFRDKVVYHAGISTHLTSTLLEMIMRERRGEIILIVRFEFRN